MPRIPPLKNSRRILRALKKMGYEVSKREGKGSHMKLFIGSHSITIPKHFESADTRSEFEKAFISFGGDINKLMSLL